MLQNSFLITAFKETKTIQKCLAGLVDETLSVAKEVYWGETLNHRFLPSDNLFQK